MISQPLLQGNSMNSKEEVNIHQHIQDIIMESKSNYVKKEEFFQNSEGDEEIEGI